MLSFFGGTLVLFYFVSFWSYFFYFVEAAAFISIVLRYACALAATRNYLTIDCVLFFFFFLEMSLERIRLQNADRLVDRCDQ